MAAEVVYPSRVLTGARFDGHTTAFPDTVGPHLHGVPAQVHVTACEALSALNGATAAGGGGVVVGGVAAVTVSVVGPAGGGAAGSGSPVPSAAQALSTT